MKVKKTFTVEEEISKEFDKVSKEKSINFKSYSIRAMFSNLVYSLIKANFNEPTGPLRCLAIIASATPWFSGEGL